MPGLGLIPGWGMPGERNGDPLQYSCLENPIDGGAWWAIVHEVAKSWTQLNNFTWGIQTPTICTERKKKKATDLQLLAFTLKSSLDKLLPTFFSP